MKTLTSTPRLYVGTYAKYNNGSIAGEWVDLEDYTDSSEFYAHCAELHSDEDDSEYMFQDYEGFPANLYCESGNVDAIYEYIDAIQESGLEQEIFDAGLTLGIPLESIEEAYVGSFDNDEDFAQEQAESCGALNDNAVWPYTCIDWERAARELMQDYNCANGHYFSANW